MLLSLTAINTRVTSAARKESCSFCPKCRWLITAKHACILRVWLCVKRRDMVHGCMVNTERAETAAVLSGSSHVRTKQKERQSQTDIMQRETEPDRHYAKRDRARQTLCKERQSQTDIMQRETEPDRHYAKRARARQTLCKESQSQTDIMQRETEPDRHYAKRDRARQTLCKESQSQTDMQRETEPDRHYAQALEEKEKVGRTDRQTYEQC